MSNLLHNLFYMSNLLYICCVKFTKQHRLISKFTVLKQFQILKKLTSHFIIVFNMTTTTQHKRGPHTNPTLKEKTSEQKKRKQSISAGCGSTAQVPEKEELSQILLLVTQSYFSDLDILDIHSQS